MRWAARVAGLPIVFVAAAFVLAPVAVGATVRALGLLAGCDGAGKGFPNPLDRLRRQA